MRSMGEICERPGALGRFLANRREDVGSRRAFRNFQQFGVDEREINSAGPKDFADRLKEQAERYRQYLADGKVPLGWERFAQSRGLPPPPRIKPLTNP